MTHVYSRASTANNKDLVDQQCILQKWTGPTKLFANYGWIVVERLGVEMAKMVEMVEMVEKAEMVGMLSENVGLPKRELEPPTAHSIPWFKVTTIPHAHHAPSNCHHAPVAELYYPAPPWRPQVSFPGNVQSLVLLVVVNLGGNTHQLVDGQDRPTPKLGSSSKTIHPLPLFMAF